MLEYRARIAVTLLKGCATGLDDPNPSIVYQAYREHAMVRMTDADLWCIA
jgi:hypothetical protein